MKRDILYVDDEFDNIVVFESTFEDEFNILSATSGAEALEILERTPVPVVVADQRMPEMTGAELFEIIRQRYPHTKRILLTGYSEPEAMLDAINKGQIFYFVKKPWDRPMLHGVLVRAIEAHDLAVTNTALTDKLLISEREALLGQATARITHEMGNQLSILPLLELIESKYSDQEELTTVAQFARETYERLVALVDEVKTFMRFEQETFAREPVSVSALVQELISFLRFDRRIPHERFTLQLTSDSLILANKVKIQQVLVNLIVNAAHAICDCEEGEITISVQQDSQSALLVVSDNGCGMDETTLARIWEPFFTTKGDAGNGLGLDVARRIIESHDGTIHCESAPRQGTRFFIEIPRIEGSAVEIPEETCFGTVF